MDKVQRIKEKIERQINDIEVSMKAGLVKKREGSKKIAVLKPILSFIDSMQKENKINVCETSCPFKGIVTELPCWCCMYNKNKREE